MQTLVFVLEVRDYLREQYASIAYRSIEVLKIRAVMALEFVLKEGLIGGLREVYPVMLEFVLELSLALDYILLAALLLEP